MGGIVIGWYILSKKQQQYIYMVTPKHVFIIFFPHPSSTAQISNNGWQDSAYRGAHVCR